MCGKDTSFCTSETSSMGSPPLAREGLLIICFNPLFSGITPARAGRTVRVATVEP